jgi:hypothetical protein
MEEKLRSAGNARRSVPDTRSESFTTLRAPNESASRPEIGAVTSAPSP